MKSVVHSEPRSSPQPKSHPRLVTDADNRRRRLNVAMEAWRACGVLAIEAEDERLARKYQDAANAIAKALHADPLAQQDAA